jgi:hypothetical protein
MTKAIILCISDKTLLENPAIVFDLLPPSLFDCDDIGATEARVSPWGAMAALFAARARVRCYATPRHSVWWSVAGGLLNPSPPFCA